MAAAAPSFVARAAVNFSVLAPGLVAPGLGLVVCKGCEDRRRDVPRFADQIHRLVIAEYDPNTPAGGGGLRLERHQQVHDGPNARAPVRKVTGLNERHVAARPDPPVGQPGGAQDGVQAVNRPMNIADRDDAAGGLTLWRCGRVGARIALSAVEWVPASS